MIIDRPNLSPIPLLRGYLLPGKLLHATLTPVMPYCGARAIEQIGGKSCGSLLSTKDMQYAYKRQAKVRKDIFMNNERTFTKGQQALYVIASVACLIVSLLLGIVGWRSHTLILQGLSWTMLMIPVAWLMAFFHKDPRFPWRGRTAGATTCVLLGILSDWLLSTLALSHQNSFLLVTGILVCIAPTFFFRITEKWYTAREREHEPTV